MWRTLQVILYFVILHRRLCFCSVGGDRLIHQTLTLLLSPLEKQWQFTKETDWCNFPSRTKHREEIIYYGALLNTTFSKRRIQAWDIVSLKRHLLHKGKKAFQRGTRVAFPKGSHNPAGSTLWTLKMFLWIFMRQMVCHGIRRHSSLMDQCSLLEYFFPWFSRKVHKKKGMRQTTM